MCRQMYHYFCWSELLLIFEALGAGTAWQCASRKASASTFVPARVRAQSRWRSDPCPKPPLADDPPLWYSPFYTWSYSRQHCHTRNWFSQFSLSSVSCFNSAVLVSEEHSGETISHRHFTSAVAPRSFYSTLQLCLHSFLSCRQCSGSSCNIIL